MPNEVAMCLECLRSNVSITTGIDTNCEVVQCKKCEKWNTSTDCWQHLELESPSFLAVCLKKVGKLETLKFVDAKWIWTEPHSKRLKIEVCVEKSVLNDKITVRQSLTIEFVIKHKQCLQCIREATDHTWGACVQVRQRHGHQRGLIGLEQHIIKSGLHSLIIDVGKSREGIDLYFRTKSHAEQVVEFISRMLPTKVKASKKLISRDLQSQISRHELTFLVEVVPVLKGDLVVNRSGLVDFWLVSKVSSVIHLINPSTLARREVNRSQYFTDPLLCVLSLPNLVPFIVLDICPVSVGHKKSPIVTRDSMAVPWAALAEAEIMRESDFGQSDTSYRVLTHLGNILQAGDKVLGYDLDRTAYDDSFLSDLSYDPPSIILVRKVYECGADKISNSNTFTEFREVDREMFDKMESDDRGLAIELESGGIGSIGQGKRHNVGDLALDENVLSPSAISVAEDDMLSEHGAAGGVGIP